MNHQELTELAALNAVTNSGNWTSWESPIGLTIFFIGMTFCGVLVRYAFLMK